MFVSFLNSSEKFDVNNKNTPSFVCKNNNEHVVGLNRMRALSFVKNLRAKLNYLFGNLHVRLVFEQLGEV